MQDFAIFVSYDILLQNISSFAYNKSCLWWCISSTHAPIIQSDGTSQSIIKKIQIIYQP